MQKGGHLASGLFAPLFYFSGHTCCLQYSTIESSSWICSVREEIQESFLRRAQAVSKIASTELHLPSLLCLIQPKKASRLSAQFYTRISVAQEYVFVFYSMYLRLVRCAKA